MSRERNLDCSLVDNDLHLEGTVGKDFVLNFRKKNNSIALLKFFFQVVKHLLIVDRHKKRQRLRKDNALFNESLMLSLTRTY